MASPDSLSSLSMKSILCSLNWSGRAEDERAFNWWFVLNTSERRVLTSEEGFASEEVLTSEEGFASEEVLTSEEGVCKDKFVLTG